ncbi:MAG TPA: patatin-like phospholipase family protein [Ramlibacter sp.]|uniref:patatin-like phospholipase family protein n=1 Tax=Ramlibacter sp. TaxID=1917967 RepID=UPI002ED23A8D
MPIDFKVQASMRRAMSDILGDARVDDARSLAAPLRVLFGASRPASGDLHASFASIAGSSRQVEVALHIHREFGGGDAFLGAGAWLRAPKEGALDDDPARRQHGFTALMTSAALAMALGDKAAEAVEAIVQIGFGVDPVNTTIRQELIGNWGRFGDPLDIGFELPAELLPYKDLIRNTCVGQVHEGLAQLGQAAAGFTAESGNLKISRIQPDSGCAGELVSIGGTGFGASQPAGSTLYFTAYKGGKVTAKPTSWSDTLIEVVAPVGVGDGPVGLLGMSSNGATSLASALDTFGAAADACLGPGAGRVVQGLSRFSGHSFAALHETAFNVFHGGPPKVTAFTGNGNSATVYVRPGGMLRLAWDVKNTQGVQLRKTGAAPQLPGVAGTLPPKGSVDLGPLSGTTSWSDGFTLTATNTCGSTQATLKVEMKDRAALVLSGGGSKASFEVGAVRCLYDVFKFSPDIITGSSAGSLNAVKLAEGPAALPQLEAMWLGLRGPSDMFEPTGWVVNILTQWKTMGILPQQFFELSEMLGLQVEEYHHPWIGPEAEIAIGISKQVFTQGVSTFGLFTIFDVLMCGLQNGLALGKLITEIKRLVETGNALFLFDPVRRRLDATVDPAKVRGSGITLRISVLDLNSGRTRYVNEAGRFIDTSAQMPLLDAVQASASIPVAFAPVVNASGTFLDGGTRDNLPLAAADLAGASSIVAIVPSPLGVAPGSYNTATLLPILGRSVEVIMDEGQLNDYLPHRGFNCPTKMIAPTFEVHNLFAVDPGLVQISMDYGYMRAYDVMQPDDAIRRRLFELSDQIVRKRLDIWGPGEHRSEGQLMSSEKWGFANAGIQRPGHTDALQVLREQKRELRELCRTRLAVGNGAACMPAGIERAWQQFEGHPWQPMINTPWDASSAHYGTPLPAEPAPGPL